MQQFITDLLAQILMQRAHLDVLKVEIIELADVLGIQVWNADFRKQVVLQSSLYYKHLTLLLCFVINKCQTRTSDKLEKCVHSVVSLRSMCRYLYRTKNIHGVHEFLFSFEVNRYEIIPITSGRLWRTCPIARYVSMMF